MGEGTRELGVASGYEKADCMTAPVHPVSGQSSHLSGRLMVRAVDWIMLTSGYALFGTLLLIATEFVSG